MKTIRGSAINLRSRETVHSGKAWHLTGWFTCMLFLMGNIAGCANSRAMVHKHLMDHRTDVSRPDIAETYQVAWPDVIEVFVATRSEFNGRFTIGTDGRIPLADYGSVRVEGLSPSKIAERIARETGTEPRDVRVRIAEYQSQHVMLFGEVHGSQRPIAYRGQETVLDLLQRVGGITPGAEPMQVYVVRTHMESHQRSDVIHVDLPAIILKKDFRTNVRLLPFDQIYVGESSQSKFVKSLPDVAKPLAQAIGGSLPDLREPHEASTSRPIPGKTQEPRPQRNHREKSK